MDKIPYKQMLIPIAYVLNDDVWQDELKINKLEAWYWSSIFSLRYIESQDQRAKEDVFELDSFILNNEPEKPKYITSINDNMITFDMYKVTSDKSKGIYKGFMQYILSNSPYDLLENQDKLDAYKIMNKSKKIEDHHIIPKDWIKNNIALDKEFDEKMIDSCLNRVYISEDANRGRENGIFAKNPGKYMKNIPDDNIKSLFIPIDLKNNWIMDQDGYIKYLEDRYTLVRSEIIKEIMNLI